MNFSAKNRENLISKIEKDLFDVIIVGGGITGAGIALDATTRGMKAALFEMQDFSAGTSSRSTKLIHGGLRYLKQFEFKLVSEVGKERAIVYENGPHVTTPEWMLLPIYKGGTFGKFSTSIGLRLYDFLAGVKRGERRHMLSMEETLERAPLLKKEGLLGGGYYVEYRTDDSRLTIEVLKKAVELGATAVNYSKVESFIYEGGKIIGVNIKDMLSEKEYPVYARVIINATGPWVDTLREKDRSKSGKTLKLTKGVHLVFNQETFPLKQAIYYDTQDGRMVFAIPREGKTYVGTTDTFYDEDLINPQVTPEDRIYLLNTIHNMFPSLKIEEQDIESTWAGLRPLIHEEGKDPSEISRKDEIWHSESGLITVAGGKLTGYRKMAEVIVDRIVPLLRNQTNKKYLSCQTKHLPISGGDIKVSDFQTFVSDNIGKLTLLQIDERFAEKLIRMYGSNVHKVMEFIKKADGDRKSIQLPPVILGILHYSIEEEMTTKPVDFFIRRTGALFFDYQWVIKWKKPVIDYMANYYGWTGEKKKLFQKELEEMIKASVPDEKEMKININNPKL